MEFRRSLANTRVTYLEGRCVSYGGSTPYLPIVDLVRAKCGIAEADEPATVADKVRFGLHEAGLDPIDHASCVLHMLGLAEGATALTGLSPEAIKARTFETLRTWTLAGSQKRPIIMAIEDLHWIDHSSEEYLKTLVDRLGGAPIVLLCSWRPGYRPPWVEHSYVTQLPLQPLSPADSVSVVGSILQAEDVTTDLVSSIVHRAEGNPFFLEELARAIVHHTERLPDEALPDTIHGSSGYHHEHPHTADGAALRASVLSRQTPS